MGAEQVLWKIIVIGMGGFVGANLRYFVSGWVLHLFGTHLPYGTLFVNALGSFVLGFVLVYGTEVAVLEPKLRLFLATGLLGAFTTFSTFSFETFELLQESSYRLAGLNILLNLGVSLLTVWVGVMLAKLWV